MSVANFIHSTIVNLNRSVGISSNENADLLSLVVGGGLLQFISVDIISDEVSPLLVSDDISLLLVSAVISSIFSLLSSCVILLLLIL